MPIGPQDVRDQTSMAEDLAVKSIESMIDNELIRKGYTGEGVFLIELQCELPERARIRIVRDYEKLWRTVRIVRPRYWWTFEIEGAN